MASFSSLFDYGFNLILLAGVVQELFVKRKFGMRASCERFDRLVASSHLSDAQKYEADAIRSDMEVDLKEVSGRIDTAVLACRVALTAGLAFPISFSLQAAFEQSSTSITPNCDPGLVIAIPIVVSLGWGPAVAGLFAFYAHTQCSPVERRFSDKIRAVTRNQL